MSIATQERTAVTIPSLASRIEADSKMLQYSGDEGHFMAQEVLDAIYGDDHWELMLVHTGTVPSGINGRTLNTWTLFQDFQGVQSITLEQDNMTKRTTQLIVKRYLGPDYSVQPVLVAVFSPYYNPDTKREINIMTNLSEQTTEYGSTILGSTKPIRLDASQKDLLTQDFHALERALCDSIPARR